MDIIYEEGINPVKTNPFPPTFNEKVRKLGFFGTFIDNLPAYAEQLFNPTLEHREAMPYEDWPHLFIQEYTFKYIKGRGRMQDHEEDRAPLQWKQQNETQLKSTPLNLRMIKYEPTIKEIWEATFATETNTLESRLKKDNEIIRNLE